MTPRRRRTGAAPVPLRLEVVTLPVSDVDRAKSFYLGLGWRLDADISAGDDFRVVQLTPPQSQASIHFGKGLTTAAPGSLDRLYLAVSDIDAARADLISRGADVSEVYHYERGPGAQRRARFAGDRPGQRPPVLHLRVVQRPGRQRLAAPGDHGPAPRPGMGGLTWRSPRWPICCTRPPTITAVRGGRPAARLVGLVRGLPARTRSREHPGRGRRGRRALHGGGQARRSDRLTSRRAPRRSPRAPAGVAAGREST